jgi:hypothetical protein
MNEKKSFWTTLPGNLTGLAMIITATGGLIGALYAFGIINSSPELNSIGSKTINVGEQLEFTISATDRDKDSLDYSASSLPPGANFNPQTRIFSWTAAHEGSYSVHFEVNDGKSKDSEDIIISVLATPIPNNPPELNSIGSKTINVGEQLEFTISATDPDEDSLTFSASSLPSGASFDPQTRTFSWKADREGSYPVHFEVSDGKSSDSEDITIYVAKIPNNPPVLDYIGSKKVNVGEQLEFTISATDPDEDSLTFSASNLPSGASFDPRTRVFSWKVDREGSYPVHFEVSDGKSSDSEDITIYVTPIPNNPPELGYIGNKTVKVNEQLEFIISATDPDEDSLTFSASNLPSGANFDPRTRTFAWKADREGSYPVHFEVSDGKSSDSEDIIITVEDKFRILEVSLRADPSHYVGPCPVKITFTGKISVVGGSGIVSYKFLRSDGASAPILTLSFDSPGTKEVSTTWTLGVAGMTYSGWQSIKCFDPHEFESPRAYFEIQCEEKVHSRGDLDIPQTWTADLDEGVVGGLTGADIWFEAVTATERYVTPRNGAKIAIAGTTQAGRDGCAAASLSTSKININDLPAGTYVCVLTSQGRYSQFLITAPVGPSPGTLSIVYTTWE